MDCVPELSEHSDERIVYEDADTRTYVCGACGAEWWEDVEHDSAQ